jgi:predicted TIM-barrel fold metal-dependent hydrolase
VDGAAREHRLSHRRSSSTDTRRSPPALFVARRFAQISIFHEHTGPARPIVSERPGASMRRIVVAAVGALLALSQPAAAQGGGGGGNTAIEPGESCPAGMTEIRPLTCRAPEFPAPSILDYRPRSTLVTAEHLVPRAKFPVVDFHGHPRGFESPEGLAELGAAMDDLNVRLMIAANSMSGERLTSAVAAIEASPDMRDRVRVLTGIDFDDVGPGWAERAVAQLEADAAAGAVGIGEIGKGLGLSIRKADGSRLRIDDPDLDPVWEAAARLELPVFIHTGDPPEFFEPLDYENERWLELALFPNRRFPPEEYPSFEELVTERDNLFRRHPNTIFVTAHLGWQANDLAELGRLLDELPNVYTEIGAVLYDIGRQPRAAHDFFVRYQDRILFGKDSFQPAEYPYYWRVLETADEYFDYYRGYHAFWKLYGIDLPDEVLEKVYFRNALRILPGAPQSSWPG